MCVVISTFQQFQHLLQCFLAFQHDIPKFIECGKSSAQKEIYSHSCIHVKKGERSQTTNYILSRIKTRKIRAN
jgi:hypothetical protein